MLSSFSLTCQLERTMSSLISLMTYSGTSHIFENSFSKVEKDFFSMLIRSTTNSFTVLYVRLCFQRLK